MAEVGASLASQPGPPDARSVAAGAAGVAGMLGGAKTKAAAGVIGSVSRALDSKKDDAAVSDHEAGEGQFTNRWLTMFRTNRGLCLTRGRSVTVFFYGAGIVVLRVVATVAGGRTMPVRIEGVGDYQVEVPQGIAVGEAFDFEVLLPHGLASLSSSIPEAPVSLLLPPSAVSSVSASPALDPSLI